MERKKIKRGFTLLGVLFIILIVVILSGIGFTQCSQMNEKSRTAEARMVLNQLRQAQRAYFLNYASYSRSIDLGVDAPTTCTSTHYFYYSIPLATDFDFSLAATRCTSSIGKLPPGPTDYSVTLNADGTWSGTPGYY